ncbi:hypothetical protein [Erwinia sp. 198]|uniref:hypothetical protein n=1 Tax=Erwinia sp. 198 TaxID=2022746 RepID=UPI0013153ED8|nr:hypothetical protein [Erwinia sp. 198]
MRILSKEETQQISGGAGGYYSSAKWSTSNHSAFSNSWYNAGRSAYNNRSAGRDYAWRK